MTKWLLWLLTLLILLVALMVALHSHRGYVLIVASPWRMEMSLAVFALGLLGLNLSVNLLVKIWRLPARIRNHHLQRARTKARLALTQGLIAYLSDDPQRAEKLAAQALKGKEDKALCLMLGAIAAHESGQADKKDRYLSQGDSDADLQSTVAGVRRRLNRAWPPLTTKDSSYASTTDQVSEGVKGSE